MQNLSKIYVKSQRADTQLNDRIYAKRKPSPWGEGGTPLGVTDEGLPHPIAVKCAQFRLYCPLIRLALLGTFPQGGRYAINDNLTSERRPGWGALFA